MEDFKLRMIKEYKELKDKYEKLHRMIVKHDAGTLDFTPICPIDLLKEQASVMGKYLNILEIRAEIEGIGYDNLRNEPIITMTKTAIDPTISNKIVTDHDFSLDKLKTRIDPIDIKTYLANYDTLLDITKERSTR